MASTISKVQLEYPDLSEPAERIGMRGGDAGMLFGVDSIQVAPSAVLVVC